MTERLDLPRRYRDQIEALLREHVPGVEVWAYGSRVTGKSHKGSDLDLVLRGPDLKRIPGGQLMDLIETLEESNVPIIVQTHDWARLPENFHREIEREYVVLVEKEEQGIAGERVHCTLADACSAINYGLTASASTDSTGPKFLRITDIVSGQLDWNTVPHVVADNDSITKYRLYDGDIVIARTGASTGASLYVKNPPIAVFASYLVRLQAKPDFDARFLAYYLKSKEFAEFIRGVLGDKSAQPNASASTMTAAPLSAPKDKTEQRAIAHILGTLDDKIELNRRMNETLEEMARALFKSWFVDFDPVRAKMEGRDTGLPPDVADLFPDRLVDSELGEIPEGGEVKALGELIELAYGKALKADDRKNGSIPVYGSNGRVGWHDKKLAAGPGIVVGRKGNPGIVTWAHSDFFPIDTTFYVIPRDTDGDLPFLFFALTAQNLPSVAADSAVPGLNRNLAYMNRQLVPDKQVIDEFNHYASGIFTRRHRLEEESRTLAAQRDALLPKLISGELRIERAYDI